MGRGRVFSTVETTPPNFYTTSCAKPPCFAARRVGNDDDSTGERAQGDKPFPAIIDGAYVGISTPCRGCSHCQRAAAAGTGLRQHIHRNDRQYLEGCRQQ
jgi:hypothetical protein